MYVLFVPSFLAGVCSEGSSCYKVLCFGGLEDNSSLLLFNLSVSHLG